MKPKTKDIMYGIVLAVLSLTAGFIVAGGINSAIIYHKQQHAYHQEEQKLQLIKGLEEAFREEQLKLAQHIKNLEQAKEEHKAFIEKWCTKYPTHIACD